MADRLVLRRDVRRNQKHESGLELLPEPDESTWAGNAVSAGGRAVRGDQYRARLRAATAAVLQSIRLPIDSHADDVHDRLQWLAIDSNTNEVGQCFQRVVFRGI